MAQENFKRVKASEHEIKDRVVNIQRTAKVTKGGRTFSFSADTLISLGNAKITGCE